MKHNDLIVYYTHSGNTKMVAEAIHNQVGGTIFEIVPAAPYPSGYDEVVKQAQKEIKAGYRPDLAADIDIAPYDRIFVGTPNWHGTVAPPVAAFLESCDFSGKTVIPFCTHGGGGMAHIQEDVEKLAGSAAVLKGFDIYGSGGSGLTAAAAKWMENLK